MTAVQRRAHKKNYSSLDMTPPFGHPTSNRVSSQGPGFHLMFDDLKVDASMVKDKRVKNFDMLTRLVAQAHKTYPKAYKNSPVKA